MGRGMRLFGAAGVALALLVAGCSSSGSSSSGGGAAETTTTVAAEPIKILVTNDDGYGSDGIDALVQALREVPDVEVTVVAPLANQSGKGGSVTGGTLTATDVTTKSGYKAKAVDGTPADSIIWAIDQKGIDFMPDLVISGVNAGQNMGPAVSISGTVGAAREAMAKGIPAVAASQGGIAPPQDFPNAVKLVINWLNENMAAVADGTLPTTTLPNFNAPTCATGSVRTLVEVPVAATADGYNDTPNCASTLASPTDDIQGYLNGFGTLSMLSATQGAAS
jgi:5'-nucleotidase